MEGGRGEVRREGGRERKKREENRRVERRSNFFKILCPARAVAVREKKFYVSYLR